MTFFDLSAYYLIWSLSFHGILFEGISQFSSSPRAVWIAVCMSAKDSWRTWHSHSAEQSTGNASFSVEYIGIGRISF